MPSKQSRSLLQLYIYCNIERQLHCEDVGINLPNDLSPTTTVTHFLFALRERDMHNRFKLSSCTQALITRHINGSLSPNLYLYFLQSFSTCSTQPASTHIAQCCTLPLVCRFPSPTDTPSSCPVTTYRGGGGEAAQKATYWPLFWSSAPASVSSSTRSTCWAPQNTRNTKKRSHHTHNSLW